MLVIFIKSLKFFFLLFQILARKVNFLWQHLFFQVRDVFCETQNEVVLFQFLWKAMLGKLGGIFQYLYFYFLLRTQFSPEHSIKDLLFSTHQEELIRLSGREVGKKIAQTLLNCSSGDLKGDLFLMGHTLWPFPGLSLSCASSFIFANTQDHFPGEQSFTWVPKLYWHSGPRKSPVVQL